VKESLFNILYGKFGEARVLDLFCGSGNLGIESLSRGASYVHFNDFARDSVAVLKKNLAKLKGQENYKITISDYVSCLNSVAGQFDVIFIDPPYRFEYGEVALDIIAKRQLLADDGVAVYEWDKPFDKPIEGLEKFDERKYGKVYLNFFRKG
jgi:16S rRNA (guanine(966)-N(2))-methyltransferase RsmD